MANYWGLSEGKDHVLRPLSIQHDAYQCNWPLGGPQQIVSCRLQNMVFRKHVKCVREREQERMESTNENKIILWFSRMRTVSILLNLATEFVK